MKTINAIVTLLLISHIINGQQLSRSAISSAGDYAKNEKGISVNWTMGGIFSQTIEEKHHLTEGFQQGFLTRIFHRPTENTLQQELNYYIEELKSKTALLTINIFPNPTSHLLFLKFDKIPSTTVFVKVFNAKGKLVLQEEINPAGENQIEIKGISTLNTGVYFTTIYDGKNFITTKRFLKL